MRKALVVGINNYRDAPLTGCVRDATDFGHLLETNSDDTANFNVLLKTDVPGKHTLLELITDLFSGKNDMALFYFAGHGFINERGGYIVTPDHRKYDEGISMSDILALANNSAATNKIIILDCCYSGAIAEPAGSSNRIGHINEGITILTAGRHDEVAVEVKGRGVFTTLLLEAMKGGAADINGHVTPGSIYTYIDQALGAWDQRPVFKTNVSSFASLRKVAPRIQTADLKKITTYFITPDTEYLLDPSYEYTNHPDIEYNHIVPYAEKNHVATFKVLQKMQAAGLVEPVGAEYMYWAAMNRKSCRLTPLGAHYWGLVNKKKI